MGIELEFSELLIIQLLAFVFFGQFEVETPALRRIGKWLFIYGLTIAIYYLFKHWAAIVPGLAIIPGTIYHIYWCKKNGIDPIKATPKKKYYQLRGWKWEE